jgi:DNA-binding CsgD family transcriptional regulator/PAS domain-containing protein
MTALSAEMRGSAVYLFHCGMRGARPAPEQFRRWHQNFDDTLWAEFGCDGFDVVDVQCNPIARHMVQVPSGRAVDRREILSDAEYARVPVMGCFRRQGLHHGVTVRLDVGPDKIAGGIVMVPKVREADVETGMRDALNAYSPHITRAFKTLNKIGAAQDLAAGFSGALASLQVGAIVVDRRMRIRMTNDEAERILDAGDGIRARAGHLAVNSRLSELIRIQIDSMGGFGNGDLRSVDRPSGHSAYSVDLLPAPGSSVTLLVRVPTNAATLPSVDLLRSRFGLTAAEARVAQLATRALSKPEIAAELGLSENTVKSHLAHIREKLGVRSMTHLALFLTRELPD